MARDVGDGDFGGGRLKKKDLVLEDLWVLPRGLLRANTEEQASSCPGRWPKLVPWRGSFPTWRHLELLGKL